MKEDDIMMGRIHSIETMGLTDGPGIRYVVFFQGCNLRCSYCHNPDTWNLNYGIEITAEELVNKAVRFRNYFKSSGGGVTCSGGEPLLQPEFLKNFLKLCKENGIHTALDTAGYVVGQYDEILKYTDLVILDIKHVNEMGFKELTGGNIEILKEFYDSLKRNNTKLWIRHVVVPGVTDSIKHIKEIKKIAGYFNNVEKIELLPYHTLGVNKYTEMGINYKLARVAPMCSNKLEKLQKIV
jgi:pyruvate formate lyase activating enzyme